VIEVAVVLALFATLRQPLRGTPFAAWQAESFGAAPVTSTLLLLALPMIFLIAGRKNSGRYGLATHDLPYHRRVGLRAAGVLLPTTFLFPIIGLLGSSHEEWLGASLLTTGVIVAGVFAVKRTEALDTREPRAISLAGVGVYLGTLLLGLLACFGFNLVPQLRPARSTS